jgi:aminoglycoside phosphotransferase family enzyme/predicted kinase
MQLPILIEYLLKPEHHTESVQKVELEQTQMSFVLLAGQFVYKIKKPVDLGYLDYSSLEKRFYYCNKEIELNRRLCPEMYLSAVPISQRGKCFVLNDKSNIVEFAVKMKRLPVEKMMDYLLNRNLVIPDMVTRLADKLVEFHSIASTNKNIRYYGSPEAVMINTEENFNQTEKYVPKIIKEKQFRDLKEYSLSFVENNKSLFNKRVADRRIRDCHGDLHAAHINFLNGICIYDCIEFNDRFRYGDVASEISFLAMDIDHHGHAPLSRLFVQRYIESSNDSGIEKLIKFYKVYRAYIRGKVSCFKLDDPFISPEEHRQTAFSAQSYFQLAYSYITSKPTLLITVGLVGSGKSTLVNELVKRLGITSLSSDIIRKELVGIPSDSPQIEHFEEGIYSPEFSRKTYDTLFKRARSFLEKGESVVIDASFIRRDERNKARQLAHNTGANILFIEVRANYSLIKDRLNQRSREQSISDGHWEIYLRQHKVFESIDVAKNHLIINSALDLNSNVTNIVERILEV